MVDIEPSNRVNGPRADDIVAEAADDAGDLFGRVADRAANTYAAAKDVARQVDPFVRERPYLALGLGVLAGLVLGGLFLPPGPRVIYVKSN